MTKRYVYGTRTERWYLVGPEDRDYLHGIDKDLFEVLGPEGARVKYLAAQVILGGG